jgi:hypothetical protein
MNEDPLYCPINLPAKQAVRIEGPMMLSPREAKSVDLTSPKVGPEMEGRK